MLCLLLAGCASPERRYSAGSQANLHEAMVMNIERKIASIVRTSGDWEMPEFRSYEQADIDGDDVRDTVLLTTFERGNAWRRDLLVCLSSVPGEVTVHHLGAKGERMAEKFTIEGKRIMVTGQEYSESDPLCCPTKPYQAVYVVVKGRIVLQD